MPDYYEVLQVHPRAESEVIRAAYRTLARKYHPDVEGGNSARMIAINDAWDVLGDPIRRAAYDASRASGARPAAAPDAGSARDTDRTQAAGRPTATTGATGPTAEGAAAASSAEAAYAERAHAGPPPGRPSGTVLDFGRYAGWSLGEIARFDLDYLEWLQRSTSGRPLRIEIDALLRQRRAAVGGSPNTSTSQRWGTRT